MKKLVFCGAFAVAAAFDLFRLGTPLPPSLFTFMVQNIVTAALLPGVFLGLCLGSAPMVGRMFLLAAIFWFFPFPRVMRMLGIYDPFRHSDRRRPRLAGAASRLLDQIEMRLFGRQKTGGWAGIVRMLASAYRRGDFLAGRMSLFGRFGLLRACAIETRKGQAVTIGKPGSGKSTAAAIPAILLHDGPVLAFDPKGELAQRCYAARGAGGNGVKGRGDKTHVVDPANLTGLPRSRYNPLQEIEREPDTDKALYLIFKLAEALVKNPGGGENSWVYTGARDAAKGIIGYVLTARPPAQRNLSTVRRLLMEGDREKYAQAVAEKVKGIEKLTPFEVLLAAMMDAPPGPFREVIAGQADTLQKMGDRQRGAVLSALVEATGWLDLPQFQQATGACDFYLADFKTEALSVFVCLPLNDLAGVAGGFMRAFLMLFTDTMYRAGADPKAGTVLCLVDEFPQFGHIEGFCVIGPTMRSYGVKLWVLLQDLGQLQAIYPKEWESFIGCAAMVQYFAVHHGATIDYLVKSLGEKLIHERQLDGRIVKRPYPVLDREQAARFLDADNGNVIAVRYDRRPLRLKTTPYYWFLPFWMYTPDPLHKEPFLRAWMRRRAIGKEDRAEKGSVDGREKAYAR